MSVGLALYTEDTDGKIPPARRWVAASFPYHKLRYPQGRPALALNRKLAGRSTAGIQDLGRLILVFSSWTDGAAGGPELIPSPLPYLRGRAYVAGMADPVGTRYVKSWEASNYRFDP